jgi:magnesium transporter
MTAVIDPAALVDLAKADNPVAADGFAWESAEDRDTPTSARVWRDGRMLAVHPTRGDLRQLLHADPETKAWWCLAPKESIALTRTAKLLGLDDLAIEDLLSPGETPKLDRVGHSLVLISAMLELDDKTGDAVPHKVSVLLDHQVLVLIADPAVHDQLVAALDKAAQAIVTEGIPAAFHHVLDVVVDSYTVTLQKVESAVDALSESLFDDHPLEKKEQLQAFRLRRSIAKLRRVVTPMRDITASLARAAAQNSAGSPLDDRIDHTDRRKHVGEDVATRLLEESTARRFGDVADHAVNALHATDGLREVLSSAFETNLALADVHLNIVMKKLSAWAGIIAVPTLVTGFMGMNVPYPGFGTWSAFVWSSIIMVVMVLALWGAFKKADWL